MYIILKAKWCCKALNEKHQFPDPSLNPPAPRPKSPSSEASTLSSLLELSFLCFMFMFHRQQLLVSCVLVVQLRYAFS